MEETTRWTCLYHACHYRSPRCIDVMDILIQLGGRDLFTRAGDQWGQTPLKSLLSQSWWMEEEEFRYHPEKVLFLINRGIELQIGGEYGIGGLFNDNVDPWIQREIYMRWENVFPALGQVMAMPKN